MLYNNGFKDVLLESNNVQEFSKFYLKTIEQIDLRPLKIILKKPDDKPKIPLSILSNPFLLIEIDFIREESKNYNFELFKFYRTINEKVKY